MTDRIVEIGETAARLYVRNSQVVIERKGFPEVTTPLEELGVLVLSHPRLVLTQAVISRIAAGGGSVVVCDDHYLPVAVMLPFQTHTTQTERLAHQVALSEPSRKRIWQQIVRAKVVAQSTLLLELGEDDAGLSSLAQRVRSGDPDNIEAQAARIYWPRLFRDPSFRRNRENPDHNRHLNYGYTVLRAIVARAVCAAGLHPSLGVRHHNRYDPFGLAADLMEPFRPLVDRAVVACIRTTDPLAPLAPQVKAAILQPLMARYTLSGESRSLFDICARAASSLAGVIAGDCKSLEIQAPVASDNDG